MTYILALILLSTGLGARAQAPSARQTVTKKETNASFARGWVKVTSAPSPDAVSLLGRFYVPLSDGYVYASTPVGTYRALASSVEKDPAGTKWAALNGVPSTGEKSWIARAFYATSSGDVIAEFSTNPSLNLVSGCPCGFYKMRAGTTTFVRAKGAAPLAPVAYIVSDAAGKLYANAVFNSRILSSSDGGRSWANSSGRYSQGQYIKLGSRGGGIYALKIIDGYLYTGGEGGILKCSLDMNTCTQPFAEGKAYGRNVVDYASNGSNNSPPTEIFEVSKAGPDAEYMARYDAAAATWAPVKIGEMVGFYFDGHIDSMLKGGGAHEYFYLGTSSQGAKIIHTTDARVWTVFDTKGLPTGNFTGSHGVKSTQYRPYWLGINPASNTVYLTTWGSSEDLFIYALGSPAATSAASK